MNASSTPDIPIIRIEPSRGWVSLKLNELWEYRELLYFLTWRDIKVRYKQTALFIIRCGACLRRICYFVSALEQTSSSHVLRQMMMLSVGEHPS